MNKCNILNLNEKVMKEGLIRAKELGFNFDTYITYLINEDLKSKAIEKFDEEEPLKEVAVIDPEYINFLKNLGNNITLYYLLHTLYRKNNRRRFSVSQAELSEKLGVNVRTIQRQLKSLVDKGFINVKHRGHKDNLYRLLIYMDFSHIDNFFYNKKI